MKDIKALNLKLDCNGKEVHFLIQSNKIIFDTNLEFSDEEIYKLLELKEKIKKSFEAY